MLNSEPKDEDKTMLNSELKAWIKLKLSLDVSFIFLV